MIYLLEGGTRLLDDGRAQLKCLPEVEATFYEQRESLDVGRYLSGLQGEYLLLLGDYPGSQTLEDQGVRTFLDQVQGAEAKLMGMGSHFLPMEHPGPVLKEVLGFFDR